MSGHMHIGCTILYVVITHYCKRLNYMYLNGHAKR
jgi:hypothetical protein